MGSQRLRPCLAAARAGRPGQGRRQAASQGVARQHPRHHQACHSPPGPPRGGVKRISGINYEETRGVLKDFLENVMRNAITYTEHTKHKTVTAMNVVSALKCQGRTLHPLSTRGLSTSLSPSKPTKNQRPFSGRLEKKQCTLSHLKFNTKINHNHMAFHFGIKHKGKKSAS